MDTIFSDALMQGQGPKYRRLANGLIAAIRHDRLKVDSKLPPVRDLAWQLKITPGTVARAYTILSDEGWVRAEVGRGTFVQPLAPNPPANLGAAPAPLTPPLTAAPSVAPRALDPTRPSLPRDDLSKDAFLFSPRLPDVGQLAIIRQAMMAASQMPDSRLLNYPFFTDQAPLRAAIHARIPTEERGLVDPTCIVPTNGGQNAIMLCMQTLLVESSRTVLVEQHSYPGLRRAAELLGAKVVAVPMDEQGIDPVALDRIAKVEDARLLFTMPEAHNPTCIVTSPERRAQVVEVARRRGFHLVQDDCYRVGPARGPSYHRLLPRQSWFISSLAKTVSPALRAGYVIAPANWVKNLRRVVDVNYFGISATSSETLLHVLTHPDLDARMEDMRVHLRRYIEVALNVLGRFDLGWSEDVPFVWLRLPARWRVSSFCQAANAKGIRVRPGEDFALRDGPALQAVRISINGQMALADFRRALEELAKLLDNPTDQMSA